MATDVKKTTPRDFFLHLFTTGAIYFISIYTIVLLWQYINHFFPDVLDYSYSSYGLSSAIRWAVALLIIVFPAYVGVMFFMGKDIDRNPWKRDIGIRRWLIYITLFVAAVTIMVDLVVLIYNFLGGDLAVQFILKSLSVLVVAAVVFGYYLFNLRREPGTKLMQRKLIAWASSIFILVLVVGAFFIVGSPETNRMRKADEQRIGDLQTIQWQVVNYWQQKEKLPLSLDALKDDISGFVPPKDPETGEEYGYRTTGTLSFELCATFKLPSLQRQNTPKSGSLTEQDNWRHEAGEACFTRTIDPEKYPVFSKTREMPVAAAPVN